MYATAIGLILKGFEDERYHERAAAGRTQCQKVEAGSTGEVETEDSHEQPARKGGWFNNILTNTRRWFEEDEVNDFNN